MKSALSKKQGRRRRVIHRMVTELAAVDPNDESYDRKLVKLRQSIVRLELGATTQPEVPERGELPPKAAHPSFPLALWFGKKTHLAQAGRSLVQGMWKTLLGGWLRRADARPVAADRAASPGEGIGAKAASPPTRIPSTALFTESRFGKEPQRRYMLYQPANRRSGAIPLLVLLHGCNQGAQDFAAATRMNEAAESAGVMVLYPEQSMSANSLRCWNWYALHDRSHREGDAALIAAMTRHVMREHPIDETRVYVAGMSAGGAMAAVLARDYPELYAALGVHSGLQAGLAHDLVSAMNLMASGPAKESGREVADSAPGTSPAIATIVFHGDEDATVHPSNGKAIHAASAGATIQKPPSDSTQATTAAIGNLRGFTRSVEVGRDGATSRELWIVHGAGHAWAGGSDAEKYTDPDGPDASREMLRFFLQHQRPISVSTARRSPAAIAPVQRTPI